MTDDAKKPPASTSAPTPATPSAADEQDRAAILERRNRFVAAALAGLAGASLVAACGETSAPSNPDAGEGVIAAQPQPCLSKRVDPEDGAAGDAANDAVNDAKPQPCLDIAFDAGPLDATPQPCLSPPPPDSGGGGADSGGD